MGVAYYIVTDDEQAESVDGKCIASAMPQLNALAEQRGLATLEAFMGQSLEEFADLLDEEMDFEDSEGDQRWFLPGEGLTTIEALLAALRNQEGHFSDPNGVREDLLAYQSVLQAADKRGAKWHLAIDI